MLTASHHPQLLGAGAEQALNLVVLFRRRPPYTCTQPADRASASVTGQLWLLGSSNRRPAPSTSQSSGRLQSTGLSDIGLPQSLEAKVVFARTKHRGNWPFEARTSDVTACSLLTGLRP